MLARKTLNHNDPRCLCGKPLGAELDPGEEAAIASARRLNSTLLIVNDIAGRGLARRMDLTITGTQRF